MIHADDFVGAMEHHWTERLGNVSSPALRKVWKQIANTFADNIESHRHPSRGTQWTVLQPPTGSGKSQGTAVYCSLLSRLPVEEHPGALIVTRLIADAEGMAEQINQLSGRPVAVAYHSESAVDIQSLKDWPVVVITHRAYELALEHLGRGGTIEGTWPLFHEWGTPTWDDINSREGCATRKLVVIDEALDIVEHSQAGLDGLRQTLGAIPQFIRQRFPYEVQAVEVVIWTLDVLDQSTRGEPTPETMVLLQKISEGETPDLTALRQAMRQEVRYDRANGKSDKAELARLRQLHDERLRSLHTIFRSWAYYARTEAQHSLNTARLLVPDSVKGAVVLDATASSNVVYDVFDEALVVGPPPGSRSYRNVTLHVSRGHKVGKRWMANHAKEASSQLVADLNNRLEEDRKVFVCCHKSVEPVLMSYEAGFELRTGHWGAVDGSNEWQDCDTAVIFGLPYLPDTWASNVFMAMQGPQSTEWLRADGGRPWKTHTDIRRALKVGQMVVSVVQAINRVRCRRVIDAEGNCPKAEVYLALPTDKVADEVLDGIRQEMPDINIVEDWSLGTAKRKPRRSNHGPALAKFFEAMKPGRQAVSAVKDHLGMSARTFDRLVVDLKDHTTELYQRMVDAGVRYEVHRAGRTQRAFFAKA